MHSGIEFSSKRTREVELPATPLEQDPVYHSQDRISEADLYYYYALRLGILAVCLLIFLSLPSICATPVRLRADILI